MARSIIVPRKHARQMAMAVASIAYHLRYLSGALAFLSEELGPRPKLPGMDIPHELMKLHEILDADTEHLNKLKVFLGHLVYEAPLYSPKVKMIGNGESASP